MSSGGSFYGLGDYSDELYSWDINAGAVELAARVNIPFDTWDNLAWDGPFGSTYAAFGFDAYDQTIRILGIKTKSSFSFNVRTDTFAEYPWIPVFPDEGPWQPVKYFDPRIYDRWIPLPPSNQEWKAPIEINPLIFRTWRSATIKPGPWDPIGPDRRPNG